MAVSPATPIRPARPSPDAAPPVAKKGSEPPATSAANVVPGFCAAYASRFACYCDAVVGCAPLSIHVGAFLPSHSLTAGPAPNMKELTPS
jgi:hypothetical protein